MFSGGIEMECVAFSQEVVGQTSRPWKWNGNGNGIWNIGLKWVIILKMNKLIITGVYFRKYKRRPILQ